jgi:hypothetical protein
VGRKLQPVLRDSVGAIPKLVQAEERVWGNDDHPSQIEVYVRVKEK